MDEVCSRHGGKIYIQTFGGREIVMGIDHYGGIVLDVYLLLKCVFTMEV
jgi:hypothetical protein